MKRPFFLFLLSGTALFGSDDWSLNNRIFFNAEYLAMKRSKGISRDLARAQDTNHALMETKQLISKFHYEAGFRADASFLVTHLTRFELGLFRLGTNRSKKQVIDNHNIYLPWEVVDENGNQIRLFQNGNLAQALETSILGGEEINFWNYLTAAREDYFAFSWLIGLRHFLLKDHFRFRFQTDSENTTFRSNAKNNLVAVQTGFDLQWNPTERFSWDLIPAFGVGINYVRANKEFDSQSLPFNRVHNKRLWSYYVDLKAIMSYQFVSHASIYAGYEMIALYNMVLAPDLWLLHSPMPSHGKPMFHGGFGGISIGF